MSAPTLITIPQLSRLIGTAETPVLVDVRTDQDFEHDPRLLPTSFRHAFRDVEELLPELYSKQTVVICQKGRKLSQGAAALLRHHGISAAVLEGGHLAWRSAAEPLVPAARLPWAGTGQGSVWVSRQGSEVFGLACPWLIRRFVDRNARFLFVSRSEVADVSDRFDAIAFDMENDAFDILIEEFGLKTEALNRLATIVRGAVGKRTGLTAQSAGLAAMSSGLLSTHPDDLARMDAGMMIYDSLYRWARPDLDRRGDRVPAAGGN